jgi:DNA-directed RNA polymerase specialized sigma subunit
MDKKEIERLLKDYYWKINSIKEFNNYFTSNGLVAQYGIESSLPKPRGTTSDPVNREMERRQKRRRTIAQYELDVAIIQDRMNVITDEREIEVLNWLLDGKSYRWIGNHMGLSFSHIKRIRDSIVEQLANETNGTNGTKETDFLSSKKIC